MSQEGPAIDPEILERLRRSIPLRVSKLGEILDGDEPVAHAGIRRVFREGLDLNDEGEPIVRVGRQWCYITVDDCMLRATAVDELDASTLALRLDDGRTVPLDPATLWEEPGRGLRCTAPSRPSARPLTVRFTNQAQMDLNRWIEHGEHGRPVLAVGSMQRAIPERPPTGAEPRS